MEEMEIIASPRSPLFPNKDMKCMEKLPGYDIFDPIAKDRYSRFAEYIPAKKHGSGRNITLFRSIEEMNKASVPVAGENALFFLLEHLLHSPTEELQTLERKNIFFPGALYESTRDGRAGHPKGTVYCLYLFSSFGKWHWSMKALHQTFCAQDGDVILAYE